MFWYHAVLVGKGYIDVHHIMSQNTWKMIWLKAVWLCHPLGVEQTNISFFVIYYKQIAYFFFYKNKNDTCFLAVHSSVQN